MVTPTLYGHIKQRASTPVRNLFRVDHKARRPWKQLVADMVYRFISWPRFEGSHPNPEADPDLVVESGVVTGGKPTTPEGTQGNKGTPTHNTTDKPLHFALLGS